MAEARAHTDCKSTLIAEFRGDVINYSHMGGLNRFQEEAVRYYVKNQWLYDLGAGHLGWAKKLSEFGALNVTAVDSMYKDRRNNALNDCRDWHKCVPSNTILSSSTFSELYREGVTKFDAVFVSWPDVAYGKTMGIELLTRRADTVIYLGKTTDGTMCGSPQLWSQLIRRKVLCYLPAVRNSLIVYGAKEERRPLLLDEEAGLNVGNYIRQAPKEWPLL